jgi:hypothetical protein
MRPDTCHSQGLARCAELRAQTCTTRFPEQQQARSICAMTPRSLCRPTHSRWPRTCTMTWSWAASSRRCARKCITAARCLASCICTAARRVQRGWQGTCVAATRHGGAGAAATARWKGCEQAVAWAAARVGAVRSARTASSMQLRLPVCGPPHRRRCPRASSGYCGRCGAAQPRSRGPIQHGASQRPWGNELWAAGPQGLRAARCGGVAAPALVVAAASPARLPRTPFALPRRRPRHPRLVRPHTLDLSRTPTWCLFP